MDELMEGKARLDRLKYSHIVLIPKRRRADKIGDFRLIALLNSSLKVVSKVFACRLTPGITTYVCKVPIRFNG